MATTTTATRHLAYHASRTPEHPAVVVPESGEVISYAELDAASNRFANVLWDEGLRPGDHVALLLDNSPTTLTICWALQRSGLYYTPIAYHASVAEASFIVDDCEADTVVASAALADLAEGIIDLTPRVARRYAVGGRLVGHESYEERVASASGAPLANEREGRAMVYSSGSTGRPKGVKVPLPTEPMGTVNPSWLMERHLGMDASTVFLSVAPLYHGAPLYYAMGIQRIGGTVVLPRKFDARATLEAIERWRVTGSYMVPTMFVRLLKLPPAERDAHDVSSLEAVVHSGGPCPVAAKREMLEWWGPVVYEFYAGTERNGMTFVGPAEWLEHPGTVGRAYVGEIKITDEDGELLPPGSVGTVWFAGNADFEYQNDPAATVAAHNAHGWSTLGDIGYVDEEGYLFLTDRREFMIVSGGVNIAPREVEDVLIEHPSVLDAAVFGVPNDEWGEEVKAVVELVDGRTDTAVADELIDFCRDRLSHVKCPRSVDVVATLPRTDSGKLRKRQMRAPYWEGHAGFVV